MSEVKIEDMKSSDYKYIYTNGAFGGIAPEDARIIFYLDRLVPKTLKEGEKKGTMETDRVLRELQVEVHMSPQEFVTLWLWMGERLKIYKDSFPQFPLNIPKTEEIAEKVETEVEEKK